MAYAFLQFYGELQTYLFIVQSVQLKRVYFMKGYFSFANRGTSRRNELISVLLLQRDETCDMQLFAKTSRIDTLQYLYNFNTAICPENDLHFMPHKRDKLFLKCLKFLAVQDENIIFQDAK